MELDSRRRGQWMGWSGPGAGKQEPWVPAWALLSSSSSSSRDSGVGGREGPASCRSSALGATPVVGAGSKEADRL